MKYIRTKQGCIVDTTNMHLETLKWYQEVHLLKQADTIEELCDEFVYMKESEHKTTKCFNVVKGCKEEIYGAIWADKGLIYVAKLNDKGELELL